MEKEVLKEDEKYALNSLASVLFEQFFLCAFYTGCSCLFSKHGFFPEWEKVEVFFSEGVFISSRLQNYFCTAA